MSLTSRRCGQVWGGNVGSARISEEIRSLPEILHIDLVISQINLPWSEENEQSNLSSSGKKKKDFCLQETFLVPGEMKHAASFGGE